MDGDERSEAPSASAPEAQSLKPKAKQAVVIGTACSSPKTSAVSPRESEQEG